MYENNSKEALQYLVGLGEVKLIDVEGQKYSSKELYNVREPKPAALQATTLTALVDYIKANFDKKASDKLLIHVVSHKKVILYSELRSDQDREGYIECNALLPDNIHFNNFLDPEQFNIMLQSSFVENNDRSLLLKITGNIQDNAVKTIGDNGVSQSATIKTGVASVNEVAVPNPVNLAPYRTFPEIDQPISKFIFRMRSGPSAALYEADGGAWRNEAMEGIKLYLKEELKGVENVEIIS